MTRSACSYLQQQHEAEHTLKSDLSACSVPPHRRAILRCTCEQAAAHTFCVYAYVHVYLRVCACAYASECACVQRRIKHGGYAARYCYSTVCAHPAIEKSNAGITLVRYGASANPVLLNNFKVKPVPPTPAPSSEDADVALNRAIMWCKSIANPCFKGR